MPAQEVKAARRRPSRDLDQEVDSHSNGKREASHRTYWMRAVGKSDLPTTTKAVAWAIGSHMTPNGYAFVSKATIASEVTLKGSRHVHNHVQRLAGAGLLTVRKGGGRGYVNGYQGTIPEPLLTSIKGDRGVTVPMDKGGPHGSERVTVGSIKGDPRVPRSSTEVEKKRGSARQGAAIEPQDPNHFEDLIEAEELKPDCHKAHADNPWAHTDACRVTPPEPGWRQIQRDAGEVPETDDAVALSRLVAMGATEP